MVRLFQHLLRVEEERRKQEEEDEGGGGNTQRRKIAHDRAGRMLPAPQAKGNYVDGKIRWMAYGLGQE